jgi:ribosomal-protein-alanine N-acetyltransferase
MKAPEHLESSRLVLRRPTQQDIDAIFERYASIEAVTRYVGFPRHRSRADTESFIARSDAQWTASPAGPYLITCRFTGAMMGGTGLQFEADQPPSTGYVLAEICWGRGFATEALGTMVELATRLRLPALRAMCHPDHRASQRVLEKCGFRTVGSRAIDGGFPNLDRSDAGVALVYSWDGAAGTG